MAKKTGLGKGLDALFIDNHTDDYVEAGSVATMKISDIEPNRDQPRGQFNDEALRELADSIREHGVIQPLVVRPLENGAYQIVAGERRWRSARMAGLSEVPVVVKELDDMQTLEIAIIENLQREDLNPIELAKGYKQLIDEHSMTQEDVAKKVGKARPVIANAIRLLNLPEAVQQYLMDGLITQGHAKALLSLEGEELIIKIAERAVKGELLVRDIEKLARDQKNQKEKVEEKPQEKVEHKWGDSYHKEMEIALSTELGRKVRIINHGKKSTIELDFYNDEELADLAARLTKTS